MLDWLDKVLPTTSDLSIAKEDGIWDDVFRKHFSSNGPQNVRSITRWTSHLGKVSAPSKRRGNAGPNVSEEEALNQELAEYLKAAMPTLRKAPPLTAG